MFPQSGTGRLVGQYPRSNDVISRGTDEEDRALQATLEARIAETERTIANSEQEIRAISARQPDTADQAAAEYERQTLAHKAEVSRQTLQNLRQALERIVRGTFGECAECGNDIESKRLEAIRGRGTVSSVRNFENISKYRTIVLVLARCSTASVGSICRREQSISSRTELVPDRGIAWALNRCGSRHFRASLTSAVVQQSASPINVCGPFHWAVLFIQAHGGVHGNAFSSIRSIMIAVINASEA